MLENEQQQNEQQQDEIRTGEDYVKAVKNLKQNMVDKADYDKVVADNAALVKAIAEGQTVSNESAQETAKPDIKELRKKFLNADESMSNAEYVQTALELRAAIIAEGGLDPFLPTGEKISPDVNDIKGAAKVAEGLEYCLEQAKGEDGKVDPELFNAHFNKILAADSPLLAARLKTANLKRK